MKYPRTPHAFWSQSKTEDDIESKVTLEDFALKPLVVTEKLDGEICCFNRDSIHARSIDSGYSSPWQTAMRKRWEEMRHTLPVEFWFFGESMYGTHSIEYESIPDLVFIFALVTVAFDGWVMPWDMTKTVCRNYSLSTVPWIRNHDLDASFSERQRRESMMMQIPEKSVFGGPCEGYVIRNRNAFPFNDFSKNVMKVVRKNHVQTDEHWTKHWKKANICIT